MVLCSLRMVQLWELIWLGSMPKGIAIYEENSSCHNHKDAKRNTLHFWFLYNKTFFFFFFKGYCLYLTTKEITKMCRVQKRLLEIHLFGRKGQREKRWNQSDLFRWYKGDNYGFLFQIYWRWFVFSALLTKLSGFTKILFPSLGSDRTIEIQQVIFTVFSVSVWSFKCLSSFWTPQFSSADCLYGVRRSIDNFWPHLWIIICKSFWPPWIFV